jgi:hypothetical protein
VLVLASSAENLQALAARRPDDPQIATTVLQEGSSYNIYIADLYNNAPGAETELTFRADDDCQIVFPENTDELQITVPDLVGRIGAFTQPLRINGTGAAGGGRVSVLAADPGSSVQTQIASFACSSTCSELTDPNDPQSECLETLN